MIISPCVPVQHGTYLSGMFLHINNYTFISHKDHSNVNHISSSILLNMCIKSLIHQLTTQRHYTSLEKRTRRLIGLVSTRKGKFPERSHPSHVSEVMWLGMSKHVGAVTHEGQGCTSVTCGCLCRRRVVPVMDAFFPSPFLPLLFFFLYSFIFFFFFFFFLFKG